MNETTLIQADAGTAASTGFGALTPLLAPRSVAVIGASDRDGNLGGAAVRFLRKFGFRGEVWPVNAGRDTVAELRCYPSLKDLPGTPDLAILAVPADAVAGVLKDCAQAGVPSAVAWAGGFAEQGDAGKAMQAELTQICRDSGILLCGPNCIGIINTAIGLTASFSTMLYDQPVLTKGAVSMVSQSGGLSVMAHARAQALGLGFRVTVSVGNEASLGVADFIHALAQDEGTKVIAVYTEGLTPTLPVKDLAEFIKLVRSQPGKFSYASAGIGSAPHLTMELFARSEGLSMSHVPYSGSGPALNDVIAGHVPVAMDNVAAVPLVKAGRLKALAISGQGRVEGFPNLPTFAEAGAKDFDVTGVWGFMVPAKTPDASAALLTDAIQKSMKDPEVLEALKVQGIEPAFGPAAEFEATLVSELAKWTKLIQEAGIKASQ